METWLNAHFLDLAVAGFAAFILFELASGTAYAKRSSVSRDTDPRGYWLLMFFDTVALGVVIFASRDMAQKQKARASEQRESDAAEATEKGDTATAIKLLSKSIEESDTSASVRYRRAMLHYRAKRMDEALADFRRTAELDPVDYNARLGIQIILLARSDYDGVAVTWNEYLTRKPNDAKALLDRAGAYFQGGDRGSARKDTEKSCQLGNTVACSQMDKFGWR